MTIQDLKIGMVIRHPMYGEGTVQSIRQQAADIEFDGVVKTVSPESSGIEPAEPSVAVSSLSMPLENFVDQTIQKIFDQLGIEDPNQDITGIAQKWKDGKLVLHPGNLDLQNKEIPIETFFHKIVMIRNNLRVLEQKINTHSQLSESDKIELQQYISRSYGSLTTLNVLFKSKEDQFSSK